MPWSPEHKDSLAEQYKTGKTIFELATLFARSAGAIEAELKKQGLIDGYFVAKKL